MALFTTELFTTKIVTKKLVTTLLIGQFFLIGCGSNGRNVLDPMHEAGLLRDQQITSDSLLRDYHLYLPSDPSSAPIVFLFHGNGGSSDQILGLNGTVAPYKVWMDIALTENIILVVPNGREGSEEKQGWNDCRADASTNPDSDDVLFFNDILEYVKNTYSSGIPSVYATGISNGGSMAMRLADESPDSLNGVAIVVASRPVNSECVSSSRSLPVLIMNGTDDPLVPHEGGQIASNRGEVFSTQQSVDYWVQRNGTDLTPIQTIIPDIDPDDESSVRQYSYNNGTNGARVEYFEVVGGGHTEPSLQERYSAIYKLIVGTQNADLEMAEHVWRFFDSL